MSDDGQLLKQYVTEGSEQAFGELVRRYVNLVYWAAFRQVGRIPPLAQDACQAVFTMLAQKARYLPDDVILGGWLYRHTCFVARQIVRTECRRQIREQVAAQMNALNQSNEPAWEYLAPFLDEAMEKLRSHDRDAIVLRYFDRREMRDVAAALGITEEAAKKRVARALEKLRNLFKRRGFILSSAALATSLADYAVGVTPLEMAASISSAALAGATAVGSGTSVIFALTSMSKLGAALALLIGGAATITIVQLRTSQKPNPEGESLGRQNRGIPIVREASQRRTAVNSNEKEPSSPKNEQTELPSLRSQIGLRLADPGQSPNETTQRYPIGRAVVRAVRGTAQYTQGAGWYDLRLGKVLGSESMVRTGSDSQLDLFLGDNGPTARLSSDTILGLERMDSDRNGPDVAASTLLILRAGSIQGNIKKMAPNSKYEVKTLVSTCIIRDAEYQIKADGTITITKGSANVTYHNANGNLRTRVLNAGETFTPPTSSSPGPEP